MGSYYSTAKTLREYDARIVAALIVALGISDPAIAETIKAGGYYAVDTDVGELVGHFDPGYTPDLPSRGKVGLPGSVFQRFTDSPTPGVSAANQYSGKWNFHFSADGWYGPEEIVSDIKRLNPRNLRIVDNTYSFRKLAPIA